MGEGNLKKRDRDVINDAKTTGWDEKKEFCLSTVKQTKGDHAAPPLS